MTKVRKCYSIDDQNCGQIGRIASQKGVTESDIINDYIEKSLACEIELTSVERYHYQRVCIMKSLDSILRLCGVTQMEGGCVDKFRLALYVCHGNSVQKNRQFRHGEFELSLFEVLNSIKDMDINIFNQILTDMAHFGRIRNRYLSLYPKSEKKRNNCPNVDNTIDNNTIRENLCTEIGSKNSVTEHKDLLTKKYPGLNAQGKDIK